MIQDCIETHLSAMSVYVFCRYSYKSPWRRFDLPSRSLTQDSFGRTRKPSIPDRRRGESSSQPRKAEAGVPRRSERGYHGYPFVGLVDLRFEIDEKGEEDSKGLKQSLIPTTCCSEGDMISAAKSAPCSHEICKIMQESG